MLRNQFSSVRLARSEFLALSLFYLSLHLTSLLATNRGSSARSLEFARRGSIAVIVVILRW